MVRTTDYSLPEDLHDHIELVQPTTLFATFKNLASTFHLVDDPADTASVDAPPIVVPSAARGQVDNNCNYKITINCLQQLYNTLGYTPSATNGNQIAVTGFLELFASFADLQQFYGLQRKEALGTNFTIISVNGGQNDQANPGGEANLGSYLPQAVLKALVLILSPLYIQIPNMPLDWRSRRLGLSTQLQEDHHSTLIRQHQRTRMSLTLRWVAPMTS